MSRSLMVRAFTILAVTGTILLVATWARYRNRDLDSHGSPDPQNIDAPFYEVQWDKLPEVQPFTLTERSGEPFASMSVDGEVWVVSFFFSRCPSICLRQNETIQGLRAKWGDRPVRFVSITCDPAYDTPAILADYAKRFGADAKNWLFLTGAKEDVIDIGKRNFLVSVDPSTHATALMVIDRWGRYRDRFDWERPQELDRMLPVIDECLAETEPPKGKLLKTRVPFERSDEPLQPENSSASPAVSLPADPQAVAQAIGEDWRERPWLDSFRMVERDGSVFESESLLGRVWVANFFFTRCPTICPKVQQRVKALHGALVDQDVTFVSITSDSAYDMPSRLAGYARDLGIGDRRWLFLVGETLQTKRVASEFFQVHVDGITHDENLLLIDKWGRLRGKYRYDDDEQIAALRAELDLLLRETEKRELPPAVIPMPSPEEEEYDRELEAARQTQEAAVEVESETEKAPPGNANPTAPESSGGGGDDGR